MTRRSFKDTFVVAAVANLLIPGLGHFLWREVLFALFVFLVMLLAVVLFIVSLLLPLPSYAKIAMIGLPALFYIFTFFDLARTMRSKGDSLRIATTRFFWVIGAGVLYQLLAPSAPVNFALNNFPQVFVQPDTHLSPVFKKGDVLKASRLAYFVNLVILEKPLIHELPLRYDIVRFTDSTAQRVSGVVLGLPGEEIEVLEGVVIINSYPDTENGLPGLTLQGDWPLTHTNDYSILVAVVNLGVIQKVCQVPFRSVIGKVGRLL